MSEPDHVCIYCKKPSGAAKGQEHVVPHAFGNLDWVLPKGVVCDKCNHRFGRTVDSPFVDSGHGSMRCYLGIPGKVGPAKRTVSRKMVPDIIGPVPEGTTVTVQGIPNSKAASREAMSRGPGIEFSFQVEATPPDRESAFLSRLLLATAAAFVGPAEVLVPALDRHRENMRQATRERHLAYVVKTIPRPMRASWSLVLVPEGLVFDLWGCVRYVMAYDGEPVEVETPAGSRARFSFARMFEVEGGPEVWPVDEWARRLGPDGKQLLEP